MNARNYCFNSAAAEKSVSFALSALGNINGEHVSGEQLQNLISKVAAIASDKSADRTLKGVDRVVELLDDANEACDKIGDAAELCRSCSGSGEGSHEGAVCRACKGRGEVAA